MDFHVFYCFSRTDYFQVLLRESYVRDKLVVRPIPWVAQGASVSSRRSIHSKRKFEAILIKDISIGSSMRSAIEDLLCSAFSVLSQIFYWISDHQFECKYMPYLELRFERPHLCPVVYLPHLPPLSSKWMSENLSEKRAMKCLTSWIIWQESVTRTVCQLRVRVYEGRDVSHSPRQVSLAEDRKAAIDFAYMNEQTAAQDTL